MKLLFNKNNTGDQELKELLGFLDADLKFKNLKSDIISATNDVIALIGKDAYNKAVVAYEKTSPSPEELDFIYAVRYPIAVQGYRQYAPSNDVRHTTSGRKNANEEYEKTAFEWQIDRDNKALERRYYRALDDMIIYLDENSDEWKSSYLYKVSFTLFIRTTKQFDDIFPIGNSRLLFLKLTPGIKKAQDHDIIPRIGKELSDQMLAKIKGDEVPDFTIDENLLKKIREALVYKSMAWAYPRYSVQLFPEGTLQAFSSEKMTTQGKRPPEKSEIPSVAQLFEKDAQDALLDIEEIITVLKSPEPIDPETIEPTTPYFNENDQFLTTT